MLRNWRVFYSAAVLATAVIVLFASQAARATTASFSFLGVSFSGAAYTIDSATGQGSQIGNCGAGNLNSLARKRTVYYSAAIPDPNTGISDKLVTVNPANGLCQVVATLDFGDEQESVRGLAFAGGTLYAINNNGGPFTIGPDALFKINVKTGVGTSIGQTGLTGVQGLAFKSRELYGWEAGSVGLVTIDRATGVATDVNPAVGGIAGIQALARGPGGRLYGARDQLFVIDHLTGVFTEVGRGGYSDVRGIEPRV